MSSNPQGLFSFCPDRSTIDLVITAVDVFQSTLLTPDRLKPAIYN